MTTTIENITYEQVAELRDEARAHGDEAMAALAALALETEFGLNAGVHAEALAECVHAISHAEAQS